MNKLYTRSDTLKMLRSKEFALHVISLVESTAAAHFASAALLDDSIITIRDWAEAIEEQKRQQTSAVSVRFAYDFEFALVRACKDFDIAVLRKEEGDAPGHDFRVITSDDGIVPFEVKTTQSANGWTGSTHSKGKGKAESYVLVSYELDYDLPIPKNTFSFENVIKAVHFSVLDDCAVAWSGEATDSNSASTGKIHVNSVDEYRKSISLGSVEPKIKWCKCLREDIAQHRGIEIEAA
jgi:hypothetical protein